MAIDQLFAQRSNPALSDLAGQRVVIYGAGGKAQSLARRLRGCSRVVAFINPDASTTPQGELEAPVISPARWDDNPLPHDALILAAGPRANAQDDLIAWAKPRFKALLSLPDLMDILPGWEGPHQWAAPRAFFERHRESLIRALSRFDEPQSQAAFLDALRARLGAWDYEPITPTPQDAYAPLSLPPVGGPLRLIDCGSSRGAQALRLHAREGVEALAAFEPDPSCLPALRQACASITPRAQVFQTGLWSHDAILRFETSSDGEGFFTEWGSAETPQLPVFSIDSLIERQEIGFAPNFIRIGARGAEAKALSGALKTLHNHRPALAICASNQPAHLWSLADSIASLELGYRFYLRSHGYHGFGLVLYARCG